MAGSQMPMKPLSLLWKRLVAAATALTRQGHEAETESTATTCCLVHAAGNEQKQRAQHYHFVRKRRMGCLWTFGSTIIIVARMALSKWCNQQMFCEYELVRPDCCHSPAHSLCMLRPLAMSLSSV